MIKRAKKGKANRHSITEIPQQHTCKNCGNHFPSDAAFCYQCGQKTTVHRLNYHSIAHDFFHYFTHVERNIFSLIQNMAYRPGVVCREYLQGKRKKYFPPVNFFLIAAGLLVLSVSLFNTFQAAFANGAETKPLHNDSPLLHILTSKINWIFLFTTPVIALLYNVFFRKQKSNFFEHLAVSLYCLGFMLLLFAIFMAPLFSLVNTIPGFEVLLWIFLGSTVLHYSLTYYQLYSKRGVLSFLATVAVSVCVFALLLVVAVLLLRLYYVLQ